MFSRSPNPGSRYEAIRSLGRGGAAVVSRTFDQLLRRVVAVKELNESSAETAHKRTAFEREVRLLSFLEHPGIVPVHDRFDGPDGRPAYAMKLVAGETLADRIQYDPDGFRARPLPVDEGLRIVTRIAETVAYAEQLGVLHLDLKPENVMLGAYGQVYLMDWGNALVKDPGPYKEELGDLATQQDVDELLQEPDDLITGTPLFMSPEQTFEARRDLSPASDVFSLGVLWYVLISGQLPFQGATIKEVLENIRTFDPPPLRDLVTDLPLRISRIVERMMSKHPLDRLPDMKSVLHQLKSLSAAGVGFPTRRFMAGEVIFNEGDPGDSSYLVIDGTVRVVRKGSGDERVLGKIEVGELLGELAVLDQGARSATAVAETDCELRVMPAEAVREELEKLAPWVGSMIHTLEQRFRNLQQQLDRQ